MFDMKYTDEQRFQARNRFFQGETIPEISAALNIERRTLYNWRDAENWSIARPDDPEILIRRRIGCLIQRESKTENELKELSNLLGHLEALERLRLRYTPPPDSSGTAGGDGTGRERNRKQRKPRKNDFTGIDVDDLLEKFRDGLFEYQLDLWEHRHERNRNILKSRQIGLTFYFAREAFCDALQTGRNKIFLSASRAQADVFRGYIKSFAREWFDVELFGKDTIELQTPNGTATLYFLSTNSSTAQSYHGDVYVDEYFWIPKFDILKKVASAMASQKKWTKTYFSTPSAKSHSGYPFWSGDEYNERNKRKDQAVEIFPGRAELRADGRICPDGQWRRIITLDDAERQGCNLFDRKQLMMEYSEDEFRQLFDCVFVDDGQSCFKFSELEKCLADSSSWKWFHPERQRPYSGPVWIGYDPSRVRDGACIVVLAAPTTFRGKFFVLEKISLRNCAWEFQAGTIRDLCRRYNVEHIGIDITGPGSGVFEQVQRFFPAAEAINYTLDIKAKLVLKAQQVIASERLAWDSSYSDIAAGFLLIRRVTTQNANITYVADRSDLTGHADAAWAIMHALIHEDLILPDEEEPASYVV